MPGTSHIAHVLLPRLLLFMLMLVVGGCSAGHGPADVAHSAAPPADQAVGAVLAGLDAQAVPAGVDAGLYAELKAGLKRELAAKGVAELTPGPPADDASQAPLSWNEATATLSWYYFSSGDYDQNGEVSVSDLTPLGVHFGKRAAAETRSVIDQLAGGPQAAPFGLTAIEAVVDGDANGEIGITDITPVGQYFYRRVTSYRVYAGTEGADYPASNEAESTLAPLAELEFGAAQGSTGAGRLAFSYAVPNPQDGVSYWVRPVYGDREGTPSNVVGAGLNYAPGSLALTGITPASAEPGQIIWLKFSAPLADQLDGLTVVVDGQTEAEAEVADLAVVGDTAATAAPLLAPGPISIEAFQDGTSIGSVQLTLLEPDTELTAADCQQQYDESEVVMDGIFADFFELHQTLDPGFDRAAAEAELADFNLALEGVIEWFFEELAALSPEDQTAVLSYLENSGYFELLAALGQPPSGTSRAVSELYRWNWNYLSTDMWSAAATNDAVVLDVIGVSAALLSIGGAAPVVVAAKVVLAIFDNAVDTYIPTDLYDLRIASPTRNLVSGADNTLTVEGRFAAEKDAVNGTIDLFVETAVAGLKLPSKIKDAVVKAILTDLESKIVGKLIKVWWDLVLPPIDDPDDPCYGHIGGDWIRLDLHLYTSTDWDDLAGKVLWYDFAHWFDQYDENPVTPAQVVTVEPPYAEVSSDRFDDSIRFSSSGKYTVTLTAFSFNDTQSVLLWAHTGLKEVVREVPVWVGRFGDWRNTTVASASIEANTPLFAQVLGGKPMCIYEDDAGWQLAYALDQGAETWSTPQRILGNVRIEDFAVIDGVPMLVYFDYDEDDWFLVQATDAGGTAWPSEGVRIAETVRCTGTHSAASSTSVLEDPTATFQSSGVEPGNWVELTGSGSFARVNTVSSETKLLTQPLSGGDTYDGGDSYVVYRNDLKGQLNYQCRLGALGGVPALIYSDQPSSGFYDSFFVSAENLQGTDWHEPVRTGQDTGHRTAIRIVDGVPAYCSCEYNSGVYYRRAADAAGDEWSESRYIVDADWLWSFEVVSGMPAICYSTMVDLPDNPDINYLTELYYRRASDAYGDSWNAAALIARGEEESFLNNVGPASLAVIGGFPAVGFYHKNGHSAFSQAQDVVGDSWGEPIEVDSGNVWEIRLFEFNSDAAMCYSWVSNSLRFSTPDL